MGSFLFNEKSLIDNNIFKYEDRLSSPSVRYIDKPPVYVTWYHLDTLHTTVDNGYGDVEEILSPNSPIRFRKIENFPVYGLEPIMLTIQEEDQGLDTSYEGELVIAPNTIRPLPDSMFVIPHVKGTFIFRVKEIQYDTILANNYYRVSFFLESMSEEAFGSLEHQVIGNYTCAVENIGTDQSAIISSDDYNSIVEVDTLYTDMVNLYKALFYDRRYNMFIGPVGPYKRVYGPLQAMFMNKHKLLEQKNSFLVLRPSEEYDDPDRPLKYERSVYRFMERRDLCLLSKFNFTLFYGYSLLGTIFRFNYDSDIMVMDMPDLNCPNSEFYFFSEGFLDMCRCDVSKWDETTTQYNRLLARYIRGEELTIKDIPECLNRELLHLQKKDEIFLITPLLLFVVKQIINNTMSKESSKFFLEG